MYKRNGEKRDLHVLTHSFPTRRSSDLRALPIGMCVDCCDHGPDFGADSVRWVGLPRQPSPDTGRSRSRGERLRAARIFETRSEEHTSELQSLMRISYAVFCL